MQDDSSSYSSTTSTSTLFPPPVNPTPTSDYRKADVITRVLAQSQRGSASNEFLERVFEGNTQSLVIFFCDLFSRITLVQPAHQRFFMIFEQLLKALRIHGTSVTGPKSYTDTVSDGFVICYASSELPLKGCYKYPIELSIEWISQFFVRTQRKIYSITELPSSFTRCMISTDYCPPLRKYISEQLLSQESPDKEFWDNADHLFINTGDVLSILYMDAHHYQGMSALQSKGPMGARLENMPTQARKVEQPHSILTLDNPKVYSILYSSYLYFTYRISRCIDAEKLMQIFPSTGRVKGSLVARFFPLLLQMLNTDFLNYLHKPLRRLYDECRRTFDEIAQIAEEIRFFCKNHGDPITSRKYPHLVLLYQQTSAVNQVMDTFHDVRQQIALKHKLSKYTRWVYFSTSESQSLTELIHGMSLEVVDVEAQDLCKWFQEICSCSVKPDYSLIINAEFDSKTNKDPEDHFRCLNYEYAVLRFGVGVRYYELKMTLDFFCQEYPALFQAEVLPGLGKEGAQYQSKVFFCGCDFSGPFLVIRRPYLQIMRRIMLVSVLKSERFHKNMPIFPILSRLYFLDHPIPASRTYVPVGPHSDMPKKPEKLAQANKDEEPSSGEFSLHCTAQILSHWLQVPLIPKNRYKRNGVVVEPSRILEDEETFVPKYNDEYFQCLYFLHRLPDQLREGCGHRESFPDIACINAFRDFMEIKRPRRVKTQALVNFLALLEQNPNKALVKRNSHTIRMIRALIQAAPFRTDETAPANANKKARLDPVNNNSNNNSPSRPDQQYCLLSYDEHIAKFLDDPTDLLPRLEAHQRSTMMNWLFYAPILSNDIPPEMSYLLLCTDQIIMVNSIPITEQSLVAAKFYSVGSQDLKGDLPEYWELYDKCFTVPFPLASGGARLPEAFCNNQEPMDALVVFIKSVEMRISGRSMAAVLSRVSIDVDGFLAERPMEETLTPNNTSMLPVQARVIPRVDAEHKRQYDAAGFIFFESSFATICISGREYNTLKERTGGVFAKEQEEELNNVVTSSDTSGLAIDLITRFREKLEMEKICKEWNQQRRYREYQDYVDAEREREKRQLFTKQMSAPRMFFASFEDVVHYIRRLTNPPPPPPPQITRPRIVRHISLETDLVMKNWLATHLDFANHKLNQYGLIEHGSFLSTCAAESASRIANAVHDRMKAQGAIGPAHVNKFTNIGPPPQSIFKKKGVF